MIVVMWLEAFPKFSQSVPADQSEPVSSMYVASYAGPNSVFSVQHSLDNGIFQRVAPSVLSFEGVQPAIQRCKLGHHSCRERSVELLQLKFGKLCGACITCAGHILYTNISRLG